LRLDALLDPADRERIRQKCGQLPSQLAHPLGESIDPDLQLGEARRENKLGPKDKPSDKQLEATAAKLKEAAVKPTSGFSALVELRPAPK
jgi:hypothetical protein